MTALLGALGGPDPQRLDAYGQVLAYQLERTMNDAAIHGRMPIEIAQLRLLQAAGALRKVEQEVAGPAGMLATPIMVDASFDAELSNAGLKATAPVQEPAYAKAYDALTQFLRELAASGEINLIGVEYQPGTVSAGDAGRFPALLRDLMTALPGQQIVLTTGFPSEFGTAEDQQRFHALAFANLADDRASEGVDAPFLGVIFREALSEPVQQSLTDIAATVADARAEMPAEELRPIRPRNRGPSGTAHPH